LFYSYINQGYKDAYHQELLGIPKGTNFHQYVDGWVIIELDEAERFDRDFEERLAQEAYISFFQAQCRRISDDLFAFGRRTRDHDYSGADAGSLLFHFMEFSSLSIRAMPFLTTMVLMQDVVERQLRDKLAVAWQLQPDDELMSVRLQDLMLNGNAELPLATQAVKDVARLARIVAESYPGLSDTLHAGQIPTAEELLNATEFVSALDVHLERFDFLGTDYYVGEPLSKEQLLRQIASLVARGRTTIEEPHHGVQEPESLPSDDRRLVETARSLHFLRQHRIEAMFKSGRDARTLLVEIGGRLGLGYEEVLALTFDELQRSLSAGHLSVSFESITARLDEFGVLIENGQPEIVVGDAIGTLRANVPGLPEPADRVVGVTAYPGEHTGRVCVVDRLQDVGNVRAGDVLIAPMTSPYHVPAMAIAGAVVTNEGGILSHAAIVSRELGIPCVVGASDATEVFRSTSRVHVNANGVRGLVEAVT